MVGVVVVVVGGGGGDDDDGGDDGASPDFPAVCAALLVLAAGVVDLCRDFEDERGMHEAPVTLLKIPGVQVFPLPSCSISTSLFFHPQKVRPLATSTPRHSH
jgi:hypothetical protein